MSNLAFIILDIQNDFCHTDGVFNKNGLDAAYSRKIIPNISDMIYFCKNAKIPIIALQQTILENFEKQAIGLGYLKKMFPFIETQGLRQDTWGHDLIDEVKNVDYKIKRWGISSFYQTEFAKYLSALRINQLIISGFTTNGIVETTAREAIARNYKITTLSDCVSSYSENLHLASLNNLSNFGDVLSSRDWQEMFAKESE
ncbi:MAG: isochorismatase family cysteine hydrolase [Parachlamydiales bacterium]|jgi:ureidoacrylate peracid hydrolase